jgi:AcrR family transcriptional regulator
VETTGLADTPPRGLRERKKWATRRSLGEAALRLAVERGLEHVRVEDIATAADVSPRTFNNYFASKAEAICALGLDRAERMGEALRSRPSEERLWDAVTAVVLAEYADGGDVPDRAWLARLRLVLTSRALRGNYLIVTEATQRVLAEAIAARTGVDPGHTMLPEILAGAVISATEAALRRWSEADPPVRLASLVRRALEELAAAWPAAEAALRAAGAAPERREGPTS